MAVLLQSADKCIVALLLCLHLQIVWIKHRSCCAGRDQMSVQALIKSSTRVELKNAKQGVFSQG